MLEAYLLRNMIDIIEGELSRNNNPSLKRIQISIGELYPIDSESFMQLFKAAAQEEALVNAGLAIKRPPLIAQCNLCKNQFEVKDFIFYCSQCGRQNLHLLSGDELLIDFLEVD